ncbi:hypothetical protein DFP73DRAFT_569947 [Morchella snyderi]|nr:hypothetical protein DFP73DRAFT_569947 [Morchella snyderi]
MSSRVDMNWQERLKEVTSFYSDCAKNGELYVFSARYFPDSDNITFQSGGKDAPPPEMANTIKTLGTGMVDEHKGIADELKANGDELKSQKVDRAELRRKIEDMKVRMKTRSAESIDRNSEKLYEILKDKSETTANVSLTAWESISGFFSNIWDKITKAFFQAWEAVANFFENAWRAVENAFNSAKDWLVGAANTIASWFS